MTSSLTRALQRILNHLIALVRSLLAYLGSWWTRASQKPLLLDTGRRVYVGRKLAEGGFSFVFEAHDADGTGGAAATGFASSDHPPYVLKRIHGDAEVMEACRKEAHVHRSIVPNHPNVMPLLGMVMTPTSACLLFPYYPRSLRSEVQRRVEQHCRGPRINSQDNPLRSKPPGGGGGSNVAPPPPPWPELELLLLFREVLSGVRAMHEHRFSHRDIKLDNVLLSSPTSTSPLGTPVLMDFGSAGPLVEAVKTRRDQLEIVERASQHTTISYRPPELFEGGIRVGDTVDYVKVDVYGVACALFAASYGQGASPSECEFVRDFAAARDGSVVKVVECTHLKVLAGLPPNPPPWYSDGLWSLLQDMMAQDPGRRPTLLAVIERVEELIRGAGGLKRAEDDRQFAVRPTDIDFFDDGEDVELANRFL